MVLKTKIEGKSIRRNLTVNCQNNCPRRVLRIIRLENSKKACNKDSHILEVKKCWKKVTIAKSQVRSFKLYKKKSWTLSQPLGVNDKVQHSFINHGSWQNNVVASFDRLTFRSLPVIEKPYCTVPSGNIFSGKSFV